MTITTTASAPIYDGNDSVTNFVYSWKVQLTSDLSVVLIDANDANTTVDPSEYTINGIGDAGGGSIDYPLAGSPLATGTRLSIVPATLFTQETDLPTQGAYYADTVENMSDRSTLQIQKLNDQLSRTFILPLGVASVSTPEELYNNILLSETACEDYATESEGYRDECEDFRDDIQTAYIPYGEDASVSANTITVTLSTPISAYVEGQEFKIKVANTNTGVTTINIDAQGALNVKFKAQALVSGQLEAGQIYKFIYKSGTDMQVFGAIDIFKIIKADTYVGLPEATTAVQGISILDKYWIYGLVPSSGTDPDEEIDITAGKTVCEDGFTIVETTAVTDLNLANELGSPLAGDTTYHVYRYQRASDEAWWVSTSLTPTIVDIASALAYRRIGSVLTDGTADIIKFIGLPKDGSGIDILYDLSDGITDTTTITNALTSRAVSVPTGLILEGHFETYATFAGAHGTQFLYTSSYQPIAKTHSDNTSAATVFNHTFDINTNNDATILNKYGGTGTTTYALKTTGFADNRKQY